MSITFPGETAPPTIPAIEEIPQVESVLFDQFARTGYFAQDVRIFKADPSLILDSDTVGDTDWWIGVQNDNDGASDDSLEIGTGIVPGTNGLFRFTPTGDLELLLSTGNRIYQKLSNDSFGGKRSFQISVVPSGLNAVRVSMATFYLGANSEFFSFDGGTLTIKPGTFVIGSSGSFIVAGGMQIDVATYINSLRAVSYVDSSSVAFIFLSFDNTTKTINLGPTSPTAELSIFSGSSTSRLDIDSSGNFVFNESGASVDHRFEGDTDVNLLFLDGSADTVQVGAATASDSAKFYVSGKISTSSEIEINGDLNHDGSNIGFYGVAPVARPAAYTQTYSTADRTLNAYTSDPESSAYTGIDNLQAGTPYAQVTDLNALRVAYENLRAFVEDAVALLNSMLDDLQLNGIMQ